MTYKFKLLSRSFLLLVGVVNANRSHFILNAEINHISLLIATDFFTFTCVGAVEDILSIIFDGSMTSCYQWLFLMNLKVIEKTRK